MDNCISNLYRTIKRRIMRYTLLLASGSILTLNSFVYSDLWGLDFNLSSEATPSPFLPAGQAEDFGNFQVGPGDEWSMSYPVYDFQEVGAPVIGQYTYTLDVGADYIEMTADWIIWDDPKTKDIYESYFSLLPGEFYGFHLDFNFDLTDVLAQNQQLVVSSNNAPVVHMGDLNLFEGIADFVEDFVDQNYLEPQDLSRVVILNNRLDINLQGLAWGMYWLWEDVTYTETARIDLDFACPGDLDGNGVVSVNDVLQLLASWGGQGPEDIDGDGVVGVNDLLLLIASWGICP